MIQIIMGFSLNVLVSVHKQNLSNEISTFIIIFNLI